jgi:hypothetical protein
MTPRIESSEDLEQSPDFLADHSELTELRSMFGHMLRTIGWHGGSVDDELTHLRTFRSIYTNDIPD